MNQDRKGSIGLFITPEIEPWLQCEFGELEDFIKITEEKKYDNLVQILKKVLFIEIKNFPNIIFIQDINKYLIMNDGKTEDFLYKLDFLISVLGYVSNYGRKSHKDFQLYITYELDLEKVNLSSELNFLIYSVAYKHTLQEGSIIYWNKEGIIKCKLGSHSIKFEDNIKKALVKLN